MTTATQRQVSSYLRERFNEQTASVARKKAGDFLGTRSRGEIDAWAARQLAAEGRLEREKAEEFAEQRLRSAEKARRVFEEQRLEVETGKEVLIGTKGALAVEPRKGPTPEEYKRARESVLQSLQESAQRIAEREAEERKQFAEQQRLILTTGVASPRTALALATFQAEKETRAGVYRPVGTQIRKEVTFLTATTGAVGIEYFEQDRARREFLLQQSKEFRESFKTELAREAFIQLQPPPKEETFKEAVARTRQNIATLRALKKEEGLRGAIKEERGFLAKNIFSQLRQAVQTTPVEARYRPLPLAQDRRLLRGVTAGLLGAPGIVYVGTQQAVKQPELYTDLAAGFAAGPVAAVRTIKTIKETRAKFEKLTPIEKALATGGAGMIAYTAGSIPANIVSPLATQAIDVSLAAPTFKRAVTTPTPRSIAAAQIEALDIAIDYVGPVIGVAVGAASGGAVGAAKGAAIGSQFAANINVNLNLQQQFKTAEVAGGFRGVTGQAEVGVGTDVFAPEVAFSEDFQSTIYGATSELVEAGRFIAELPGVNVNIHEPELSYRNVGVFANEVINVNEQTNINENINVQELTNVNENLNIYEQTNLNVNQNVNVNEYVNENININEQLNVSQFININLNLPTLPGRKRIERPIGSFQAFAKVQGIVAKIGKPVTTKEQAFKIGESFVEETAARTFGVTRARGRIRGVDLGVSGRFRQKRSSLGITYIEPPSRAINTPGEISQITLKGQKAKKKKPFRRITL